MDDYYLLFNALVLLSFLTLAAIFSGAEVALFSLDKKKLKEFENSKKLLEKYILKLIEAPRRLLVTILVGNTIFYVGTSIVGVALAIEVAEVLKVDVDIVLTTQIIVLTILVLFLGEVTPKVLATKNPLTFSKIIAFPVYWIGILIYPVAEVLAEAIRFLSSKIKFKSTSALSASEFSDLADISVEKGGMEEDEQELIQGIVSFKTVVVREVMTPRVDMVAISLDTDFNSLMNTINESGNSRFPLYNNDLDDIIGIIYAKDLLPFLNNEDAKKNISLKKLARKALFIPESKLISELLQEFQNQKMHIGIVVDEYGGTSGLISLEDILEEIVGEIRDEYDKEEDEITKLNKDQYMILGKTDIDELNKLFGEDFSSENDDYDTVGGFIFAEAGNIPDEGFSFDFRKFKFTVKEIENNRINKVLLEIKES